MAQTNDVGTKLYMAPELFDPSRPPQTKVDVWSIFVTLAWVANADNFQNKQIMEFLPRMTAVQEAINHPFLKHCREMAAFKHEQRASAGDMLDKLYRGNGRSTRRPDRSRNPLPVPNSQSGNAENDKDNGDEDEDESDEDEYDDDDEDEDGDRDSDRMSWSYTGVSTAVREQARTTRLPPDTRATQPPKVSTRQLATAQNQPQRPARAVPLSSRPQQPQRAPARQPVTVQAQPQATAMAVAGASRPQQHQRISTRQLPIVRNQLQAPGNSRPTETQRGLARRQPAPPVPVLRRSARNNAYD